MRLPKFQEQQGTSMSSAMTTPAQVGAPKMRIAEVRPLVGVRDVQGELNVGLKKANLIAQVGKSVVDVSATFIDIKTKTDAANNLANQKAASAERTNFAASLATQLKIDANVLDANGKRGYETANTKYAEHMKAYDETARKKYQFSGAKAESAYLVGKTTEDRVYTDTIKVWSVDAKNEATKALNEVTLLTTRNPKVAKEILAGERAAGLETEGGMQKRLIKWQSNIIQTDMVAATENLRLNTRNMTSDEFNANADSLSYGIRNTEIPINPEVQRKLLKDLSDLRIDYHDRILGEIQDQNAGAWMVGDIEAQKSGDPTIITQSQEQLYTPDAQRRFGAQYLPLVRSATTQGLAGVTTPESQLELDDLVEAVRDGEVSSAYADVQLQGKAESTSKEDYSRYKQEIHTVADPLITRLRSEARRWTNEIIVGYAEPSRLNHTTQKETAKNREIAGRVRRKINVAIDAWQKSDKLGPAPDPYLLANEEYAKTYYIDRLYMRNSSGTVPKTLWDIDAAATEKRIDELFNAPNQAGKLANGERKKRDTDLLKAMNLLDTVPNKPEDVQ